MLTLFCGRGRVASREQGSALVVVVVVVVVGRADCEVHVLRHIGRVLPARPEPFPVVEEEVGDGN